MRRSLSSLAMLKVFFLFLLSLMAIPSQAQPLSMKRDTTLLEHPPANYRFVTKEITSDDKQRQYQLFIGIPTAAAPKDGFAVLYALDGNAVISRLTTAQLQQLSHPPIIVAIGSTSDALFDGDARTFDYTPARPSGKTVDPVHGRPAGGADIFAQTIKTKIKPYIATLAPTNPNQTYIWGHSYAGLFVVHTYFTQPTLFTHYIAASPSLWWQQGLILDEETKFLANNPDRSIPLWLLQGGDEEKENKADPSKMTEEFKKMLAARTAIPADSASVFTNRLKEAKMNVHSMLFAGLNHGKMFPTALNQALQIIQQNSSH